MKNKSKVLVVDDQEPNRRLLSDFMSALGHDAILAGDGQTALERMRLDRPDLVLLDIMMPVMDGYQVLEQARADHELIHMPIIVISGVDEMESVTRCIKQGADDYLVKPFNPTLLRARIESSLEKKRLHDQEEMYRREIEEYSLKLEQRVRDQVKEISSAQIATIFAMSKLAESRDPETGEHLERMREYCRVTTLYLMEHPRDGIMITESFVENLYSASPLHDIGKVGIPDRVLLKPGILTKDEFDVMKYHTMLGGETLRAVYEQYETNAFLKTGIDIAEGHHEKWDGSGYPNGLSGTQIPLAARVVALADVYDALTSKRCYKEAFSHEKSAQIIRDGRGKHFDPMIVDAFDAIHERFVEIKTRFTDTEKTVIE
jgi:putative two-component system response regulator